VPLAELVTVTARLYGSPPASKSQVSVVTIVARWLAQSTSRSSPSAKTPVQVMTAPVMTSVAVEVIDEPQVKA
jgi:hypothetical protein